MSLLFFSCRKEQVSNSVSNNAVDNSLAVNSGLVFIPEVNFDSATLYALDIKNGAVKWRHKSNAFLTQFSKTPCAVNNTLFTEVASFNTRTALIAFNAQTGKIIWKTVLENSSTISNPTFEKGVVYATVEKRLYAVDAVNGNIKWQRQLDSGTSRNELCSPTVINGIIYIGNEQHLFALNAAGGTDIWQVNADLEDSSPTVADGLISYIDHNDGNLKVYDINGNFKWEFDEGGYLIGSTTVNNHLIYQYASYPENRIILFGLKEADGTIGWKYTQPRGSDPNSLVYGDPFFADNIFYISLYDSLIAVNAKDQPQKKWSFFTGFPSYDNFASNSTVAARGVVYSMTPSSFLYALSAKSGEFLWKFKAADNYHTYSPVVLFDDGTAVHPTNSGMTQ